MELEKARELTLQLARPAGVEWLWLDDALGRVLALDIKAERSLPSNPRSLFDGYALGGEHTRRDPGIGLVQLDLEPGLLAAGDFREGPLGPGQCIRVLTGASLPGGCDAVIPEEETLPGGDRVEIRGPVSPGFGILPAGSDVREGDTLLTRGCFLTPSRLAMLVAVGVTRAPVFRRPAVAVLATGDEVVELGESAGKSGIFCNNRYLLSWLAGLYGAEVVQLGTSPDDPRIIAARLEEARADVLITTGGTGRGERDCVSRVWQMLGVEPLFRQLNVSPGRNASLGMRDRNVFWGLPGNPWAAQFVFEELIAPMLRRFQGVPNPGPFELPGRTTRRMIKKKGFHKAVRGGLRLQEDVLYFEPLETGAGSTFANIRDHFAYTLLGPDVVEVPAGSSIRIRAHDLPCLPLQWLDSIGLRGRAV
ncbi:MAG TPA: molybdopterin molybdotransferase MoeA [Syntrophobacteraceae bacterium]|nr:molybdopterin molybdotransferase MoeA [Syntrophobacteraceae bacterium]